MFFGGLHLLFAAATMLLAVIYLYGREIPTGKRVAERAPFLGQMWFAAAILELVRGIAGLLRAAPPTAIVLPLELIQCSFFALYVIKGRRRAAAIKRRLSEQA